MVDEAADLPVRAYPLAEPVVDFVEPVYLEVKPVNPAIENPKAYPGPVEAASSPAETLVASVAEERASKRAESQHIQQFKQHVESASLPTGASLGPSPRSRCE